MMLVLSRKESEFVVIGEAIEVMVVSIRGNKVRLGIKAPSNVKIDRAEHRPEIEQKAGAER